MADLGRQVKYAIATGSDTAVAAWLNQLSFDLGPKAESVNNESAYGVLERTNSSTVTRQWAEGSLEAKLTSDSSGYILLGAFGSVSTGDNADSNAVVKDHTFTINQNVAGQLMTLYRKDSVASEKFTYARIGQWELSMALDDYIKFTADVMARKGTTSATTPAFTDETEFVAKHFSIKQAANEAGLGAASNISTVESLTLTVNPNITPDYEAGSGEPYGFSSEGYELSFEMTKRYADNTYRDAYLAGTPLAWQITAANTDVIIGAAANPKLVITAPKVTITDWTRNEDMDSVVTETMTGTIHYSASAAKSLTAVLTNTTASYS